MMSRGSSYSVTKPAVRTKSRACSNALRAEARERWGPTFALQRYHDAALSFGSPPVRYVRELMFNLPID